MNEGDPGGKVRQGWRGINKYIRASKHTMSLKQKNSSRRYLRMAASVRRGAGLHPMGRDPSIAPHIWES